jgi:hypothetical protein
MVTQEAILKALPVGSENAISVKELMERLGETVNGLSVPLNQLKIKKLAGNRRQEHSRSVFWYRRES